MKSALAFRLPAITLASSFLATLVLPLGGCSSRAQEGATAEQADSTCRQKYDLCRSDAECCGDLYCQVTWGLNYGECMPHNPSGLKDEGEACQRDDECARGWCIGDGYCHWAEGSSLGSSGGSSSGGSSSSGSTGCGTYKCTVGFYTYGGGVVSCYREYSNGEPVSACSAGEASSSLESQWESRCRESNPGFKCGCNVDVMECSLSN